MSNVLLSQALMNRQMTLIVPVVICFCTSRPSKWERAFTAAKKEMSQTSQTIYSPAETEETLLYRPADESKPHTPR